MTDQYTPTTEEVRRGYSKLIARQRGSYSSICDEFDRWLAERDARIEAAAEQRGNLDGWDEALELLENNSEIDQDAVDHYKSLNPNRINRADQMERDE